ncbi:hypothetical protein ACIQPT_19745 [Streptomyces sp. NPDC091289]|uniref:hypothetical protein n=1 Tax=Streptomyces sp. NPDC091289 TaxID=3365989 RepID=UPI003830DA9C
MLLVVLGRVIPSWAVSATLLFVSLVLMRVVAVRHRLTADRTTSRRRTLPRFIRGLLVAAAGLGSAFGVLGDLSSDYHVLHPTGPYSCTAVVRETSFLFAGHGEVYAVGPIGIAWRPSGSWRADDGYRPITEGAYELRWSQDGGTLLVRGTEVNPVMDGLHSVDCN